MLQLPAIERRDWLAMPSPGDLVSVMADALGLPEATLISHDRLLSEAGLRSKGGRGRSAAKVTSRDAAHLLVAVLGSAQVKDSVATIERYAASRPRQTGSSDGGLSAMGIAELATLSKESSFLDAVECLISAAASGSLHAIGRSPRQASPSALVGAPLVEVAAQTPGTVGIVRIAGTVARKTASVVYALPDPFFSRATSPLPADLKAWQAQVEAYRTDTDLSQERRVFARTIKQLGRLLALTDKDCQ